MKNRKEHYLPQENSLQVAEGAGAKVAPDGTLRPFYGNTVIFDLYDEAKDDLKNIQDQLYQRCGHILSEKLTQESFHVTLHDLFSGTDREETLRKVNEISEEAKQTVEDLRRILDSSIPMKPIKLVSMVSTSIVMLLEPVYPVHQFLLKIAYDELQALVPLGYDLTPHVTLGYYRPGTIAGEDLQTLADTLSELSQQLDFQVLLKCSKLNYREFYDMNHYVEAL